jgi:hypothetical protein
LSLPQEHSCSDRIHSLLLFGDMVDTFGVAQIDRYDLMRGKNIPNRPSVSRGRMASRSSQKARGPLHSRPLKVTQPLVRSTQRTISRSSYSTVGRRSGIARGVRDRQEPLHGGFSTRFARRAKSSQRDRDHAGSPTKNPLRQNTDLSSRINVIWVVQPPLEK